MEEKIRLAAFEWLKEQVIISGDVLPRKLLEQGFIFKNPYFGPWKTNIFGNKATGQDLNNGRRTRNRELNEPNLREYRGEKLSKGRVQIRRNRYPFQPGDTVLYQGKKRIVKGTQNYGAYVRLADVSKPVKATDLKHYYYGKGMRVS